MITRDQALKLLHENMQSVNLRRHCLAVEAVMIAIAEALKIPEAQRKKWGIVGLLHDGDYEKTKENPQQHTLQMVEWLKQLGETDTEILSAILSHNFAHTGQNPPSNQMEWALYCCDELTGLIIAVALVRPDRRLVSVTVDSVMKKWDEKAFAAGVHREQIAQCEERLGIPLNEFVNIALGAMQGIADELGL